jgi:hypothetical protein
MTGSAIENKKRGRGRPRHYAYAQLVGIASIFPEVQTDRGRRDLIARQRAFSIVKDDPACRWLADSEAMEAGTPKAWQPSLLTAIGRVGDDGLLLRLAREVCAAGPRMSVKKTLRWIHNRKIEMALELLDGEGL